MACSICDDSGWVCENHPDQPWDNTSQRADARELRPGHAVRGLQSERRDR